MYSDTNKQQVYIWISSKKRFDWASNSRLKPKKDYADFRKSLPFIATANAQKSPFF
jgi:hypothetical protein